jgi:hypothetical protein
MKKKIKFNNIEPQIIINDSIYKPTKHELLIKLNGSVIKNIDYLIKTISTHKGYNAVIQGYIQKIDIPLLTPLDVKKVVITFKNYKNEFSQKNNAFK